MKYLGMATLALGVLGSQALAVDFNADGVQDTILYYGDRFVIKHNKSGVANSTVFYDSGWISTTPVETNNVAGTDLVILYRDHVTFYHDKGKTKKTQTLISGYATNPWTI